MKKYILLLLVCIFALPLTALADGNKGGNKDPKQMWKELQEFKLKFLAQEMDLDDNLKEPFFNLYNQMSEEKWKVFRKIREQEKALKKKENPTDEDYVALNKAMTSAKEQDAAIDKKYDEKFAKILSAKQIVKMKNAEEKFRRQMEKMRPSKQKEKQKEKHKHNKSSKK